jgi:hypothetical protein
MNVAAVPLVVAGLLVFGLPAVLRALAAGGEQRFSGGLDAALAPVALLAAMVLAHEALHAAAMRLLGARPRFGVGLMARWAPVVYTTAPGHRFTRPRYLAVTAAPAVLISALGLLACWLTPFGGYLALPLALHLGGCVGDLAAIRRLLPERPGVTVEDLRDGMRIHRA